MTRTFTVGDREVDPTDADAVRALSSDEFRDLMAQAIAADREDQDATERPTFPSNDPAPGTAILLPTSSPRLP